MPRLGKPRLLSLFLLAALGLAACGDTTEPGQEGMRDLIREIDDALFPLMLSRLAILSHTAEPKDVIDLALGTPVRSLEGFPAELAGTTLAYIDNAWAVDDARPAVPEDVARVIWYQLAGQSVALPLVNRGRIDLTDLSSSAPGRVGIEFVRTSNGDQVLADFVMHLDVTATPTVETDAFDAAGFVGDGTSQLEFDVREEATVHPGTGDSSLLVELGLGDAEFVYAGSLQESWTAATNTETARCTGSITMDAMGGARTEIELDAVGVGEQPAEGTGLVRHAGQTLGVLTADGFQRPDGGAWDGISQDRLLSIIVRLCAPLSALPDYFR